MTESTLVPPLQLVSIQGLSSPGECLQAARLAQGLSLEDVSERLKILRSRLVALESDQFETIPSDTYVRGYIRAYAKLLGLDDAAQIKHYDEYLQALSETTVAVTRPVNDSKPSPMNRRLFAVMAAAIVIVLVLSLVFSSSGLFDKAKLNEVTNLSTNEVLSTPAEKTAPDILAASELDAGLSASESPGSDPASTANSVAQSDAEVVAAPEVNVAAPEVNVAAPEANVALEPATTSQEDSLYFEFSAECWVEVEDARGDVLFTDIRQAGDSLSLKGKAPFNVNLGNVHAVKVLFNEKPVSTSPVGNRKARRFRIGL